MRRLLVLLTAVVVLAAACGGGEDDSAASAGNGDSPDFSGTTVEGTELVSADYAGQDVILWFWAPW